MTEQVLEPVETAVPEEEMTGPSEPPMVPSCACSPTAARSGPGSSRGAGQLLRPDLDGPPALAPPDAGRRPVGGRLPLLAAAQRVAVPRRAASRGQPLGVGSRVLRLRQRQGAPPPHDRRLRRRRGALVLQPRAHSRPAARSARGDRQCDGGEPRHRDAVLQLLGRAPVHRLRRGRHPARRHVLVPHRRTDGQRDRSRAALRHVRRRGRGPLPGHRAHHRHGRRLGHRPPQDGALHPGLGARDQDG